MTPPRADVLCVVFAKPPRAGSSKTRLAPAVGPAGAAALAEAFLADTVTLVRRAGLPLVLSTPDPGADHGPAVAGLERWPQGGGDLGARLERAFRRGLASHRTVIALGADTPHLPVGHLQALAAASPALGPTEDGGFWGLALQACPEGLLADLPWSSAQTAAATRHRVAAQLGPLHGPLHEAPAWWDVDVPADLDRLLAGFDRTQLPATWAASAAGAP